MRTARNLLVALLLVVLPALAPALDAPHDKSFLPGNCQECHKLHNALGASLTTQVTISDFCVSCHNTHQNKTGRIGWVSGDQAVAGVSGVHHRWDAAAVNAGVGSALPSDPEMAKRIIAGKLECSVCHNQHMANKAFAPSTSIFTSIPVGSTSKALRAFPSGLPTGTADLTMVSVNAAAAVARGYNLRVVSAGNVALSHDGGLTWFRPTSNTGASWVADAATPVGGPYSPVVDLAMDDPAVVVRLGTGAGVNDIWYFYVSFPMVRSPNLSGSLCLSCHQDRAQGHGDVEGGGDGVKMFSHPVGEALSTNGKGYDRAVPLDADGGVQAANGDTNATNDLVLGAGNVVGCTSCHAPHNADSNSLTVDPR
jgi:predicted CXXCH cytochrome family protein